MKNYGGSLKNPIFRGRFTKNQCTGGIALKGSLGQLVNLMGGAWQKRGCGVFEGGLIPQCTLWNLTPCCIKHVSRS